MKIFFGMLGLIFVALAFFFVTYIAGNMIEDLSNKATQDRIVNAKKINTIIDNYEYQESLYLEAAKKLEASLPKDKSKWNQLETDTYDYYMSMVTYYRDKVKHPELS